MNKPHCNNALLQLSDDQQAQIRDWLETLRYTETVQKLAEPAPDGFGLKTHRSTLHRFYRRYSRTIRRENLNDALELRSDDASSMPLLEGSADAVRHLAFQLSTSPEAPASFKEVSRWLSKQQYLKIAEEQLALARQRVEMEKQRLDLDREKFEFNAARQAIIHYAAIDQIATDPTTDNQDKINAVRVKLFGAAPGTPLPPTTNHQPPA
jgi:hypothetical protein